MLITINKTKIVEPDTSEVVIKYGILGKEFNLISGSVDLPDKGLVVLEGISGSGKTVCLREIAQTLNQCIIKIHQNGSNYEGNTSKLKDYIEGRVPYSLLASCGLSDIVTLLTPIQYLSDGQKYRLCLAETINILGNAPLIIDEFCNQLDEISTIGILKLIRRLANDRLIVVATARPYGLQYVKCDKLYRIKAGKIIERTVNNISLTDDITWYRGNKKDWEYFSQWHYRSGSAGLANNILVFKYKNDYEVGCIIGGQPYLDISCRNKLYPHYKKNGVVVNQDIYQIHRIVISPEFRGLGLSKLMFDKMHELYYAPKNKKMVELITSLDEYIPFAKKAGFTLGGELPPNPVRERLLKLNFDFTRFTQDEYVKQFVLDNETTLTKAVIASYNRGMSGDFKPTLEEVVFNVQRMCNVKTSYYYKRFD
jgi:ABC-type phosphate transport system ATPase subunit